MYIWSVRTGPNLTVIFEPVGKKRFYPHNTMVCTPLAQHPPAGQAATRSECGRRAHTWPWQYARATPQPPRARNCAVWNAVCPQWHKAPTKAQIHSTLLLAAAIRLAHACAHDERCVKSRFDHGERMPSSNSHKFSPWLSFAQCSAKHFASRHTQLRASTSAKACESIATRHRTREREQREQPHSTQQHATCGVLRGEAPGSSLSRARQLANLQACA